MHASRRKCIKRGGKCIKKIILKVNKKWRKSLQQKIWKCSKSAQEIFRKCTRGVKFFFNNSRKVVKTANKRTKCKLKEDKRCIVKTAMRMLIKWSTFSESELNWHKKCTRNKWKVNINHIKVNRKVNKK